MIGDEARLDALSALVLQWHRGSRDWPTTLFQARACELLGEALPFDACLWSAQSLESPDLHGVYLHGLPDDQREQYQASDHRRDPLRAAACAAPGTPVCWPPAGAVPDHAGLVAGRGDVELLGADGPQPLDIAAGAFLQAYAMGSALCTTQLEPLTSHRVTVSLWRRGWQPAFSGQECQRLRFLMPQLIEAWRDSQFNQIAASSSAQVMQACRALCDVNGVLLQLDPRCARSGPNGVRRGCQRPWPRLWPLWPLWLRRRRRRPRPIGFWAAASPCRSAAVIRSSCSACAGVPWWTA